jgi:NAD(P)-dependent dehydrogenase (short-subunit alcohol dehydrogenase family)
MSAINNAGITGSGQVSPQDALDQIPSSVDLDMVRAVVETNVFGVLAVTHAMLPLLRKAPAPRIVNVNSGIGSLTIASDPDGPLAGLPTSAAYAPSKTALNALAVRYANELRNAQPVSAGPRARLCTASSASTGPDVHQLGSRPIAVSAAGAATSSAPSTSGAPRTPSTAWLRRACVRRE